MKPEIATASEVTLHFSIALQDGRLVDSNFEGQPASFVMGDGKLLPGFEAVLEGLQAGDKRRFTIAPENGFGMPNPSNVQRFKREQFDAAMDLQPGLMVSFADAANAELAGVVKSVDDKLVEVDFNHPLAGEHLVFEVHIVDVKTAAKAD